MVPSSLPDIDAVEVVTLRGLFPNGVAEYMLAAKKARRARLVGVAAEEIAAMWRALPDAEQTRCHVPPFGLRFFEGCHLICEASICWRCNNIYGQAEGNKVFFEFDGSHPTARAMLKACEAALGEVAEEESL